MKEISKDKGEREVRVRKDNLQSVGDNGRPLKLKKKSSSSQIAGYPEFPEAKEQVI